ncbi:MAG: TfoX/Sxy family protein [Nakamurella sp.]
MLDKATQSVVDELVEALLPLDVRARAMFGGYCFYVNEKVAGLVCDGRIFVKRSLRDDLLQELAELAPAYPGAKDSWRLPEDALRRDPDRIRQIIGDVAATLPQRRTR